MEKEKGRGGGSVEKLRLSHIIHSKKKIPAAHLFHVVWWGSLLNVDGRHQLMAALEAVGQVTDDENFGSEAQTHLLS